MNVIKTTDITKLDLDAVLEQSRPRRNQSMLAPMFLGVILLMTLVSAPGDSAWMQPLVPLAMALIIFFSIRHASRFARKQREEADTLQAIDENMRLGRWDMVAAALSGILSSPAQRPYARFQALIYLGGLFNRLGRFGEVIKLYDYLDQQAQFPPAIALSLKCMRAYAMLRDEQLSDAYQAISELRREYPQGSGALSVLEIYRLVKTGHHEDALQMFAQRRGQIAEQLSHRSADAWALAGTSALALSQTDLARTYARNASLLADRREIICRFPECGAAMQLVWVKGGATA